MSTGLLTLIEIQSRFLVMKNCLHNLHIFIWYSLKQLFSWEYCQSYLKLLLNKMWRLVYVETHSLYLIQFLQRRSVDNFHFIDSLYGSNCNTEINFISCVGEVCDRKTSSVYGAFHRCWYSLQKENIINLKMKDIIS